MSLNATQLICLQSCSWQIQSSLFNKSWVSCSCGFLWNFFQRYSVTTLNSADIQYQSLSYIKACQLLHFPHLGRVGRNLCDASGAGSESWGVTKPLHPYSPYQGLSQFLTHWVKHTVQDTTHTQNKHTRLRTSQEASKREGKKGGERERGAVGGEQPERPQRVR